MNKSYSIYIINQYISQYISKVVPEGHRRTPRGSAGHQDVDDEGDVQTVPGAAQEEGSMIVVPLLLTIIADVLYLILV